MPRLLVVHHTPSPSTQELLEAVLEGARNDAIEDVEVVARAALAATAHDVVNAQGFVLGTPANIGYMSGALKHFFDTVYYPVLEETTGRPYGLWVHGNNDTAGAVRAVGSITKGLGWEQVADVVEVVGEVGDEQREACWNLGATVAAHVAGAL